MWKVKRTFVIVKFSQIRNELGLVLHENIENGLWFVGVGHEDFEDMEGFELNGSTLIAKQHHHHLEI